MSKFRTRKWARAGLMLASSLALLLAGRWAPAQQGAAPVVVAPVVQEPIAGQRMLVGSVMPRRASIIGSAAEGRVDEMLVREGDWVEQDAPLARLRTRTIELEIAAAKAHQEYLQHVLEELENGTRPNEVLQAKALRDSARAQRDYAQARFNRINTLYRQGQSVSQEQMEEASSAAAAAEQAYVAADAAYQLKVEGPRLEQIQQARATLQAQIEEVHRLEDQMEKFTIRAPFNGYVVAQHTEVGAWIKSGDLIAEVIELDPVEVHVNVPESHVAHLQEGMPVPLIIEALPGRDFQGIVSRIVPRADVRTRAFPVHIELDNPQQGSRHLLNSGMMARAILPSEGSQTALLIPKDALVLGGQEAHVVAIDPQSIQPADGAPNMRQGTVKTVPVKQGLSQRGMIQVTAASGSLAPGQLVVTIGNERLRPGQTVTFATPDS